MAKWSTYRSRITTSVRTTNRMNALLNESMQSQKKKPILKQNEKEQTTTVEESEIQEEQKPKIKIEFFRTNFTMEYVHKIIGEIIEERLSWDRFNRVYDPWKSAQLAESLAVEIRDRVKTLNYRKYRIVCLLSVVEKKNQGLDYKMKFLVDEKMDNFTTYIHERATYNIVATVFLVYKD
ncbi:dynein light chain Tctex-type 5 [Condylostylus longicornis]|uniref:dynein light chain Tctex-type 5 n=1 Tax=Condylostylus longicornis TaxID=2530218 RepID=UPI00244DF1AD|nr:dynein light chain Tctex-type 5 [Condylostylus longicornis]